MPSYKSSSHARPPYSATGSVQRAPRRVRKPEGVLRPSLPELGLYRTFAELAKATPFPEYVIRKWILEGYVKKVRYGGEWFYSRRQLYRWFLFCHEQVSFFTECLSQDFGFPMIYEDGKYKRWYP